MSTQYPPAQPPKQSNSRWLFIGGGVVLIVVGIALLFAGWIWWWLWIGGIALIVSGVKAGLRTGAPASPQPLMTQPYPSAQGYQTYDPNQPYGQPVANNGQMGVYPMSPTPTAYPDQSSTPSQQGFVTGAANPAQQSPYGYQGPQSPNPQA